MTENPTPSPSRPKLGLALGSGSARGWAHIGVIRALEEQGLIPDVICGCSIGALVGGAYAAGALDRLTDWVRALDRWQIVKLMDVSLEGGLIEGDVLMSDFGQQLADLSIEQLPRPFSCVATDLRTGREVWLREGSLLDAVRASIALPGLFTPFHHQGRWLVDGGLVNPIPVSICRAMGAEHIIAVNLNGDIVGKHLRDAEAQVTPGWGFGNRPQDLLRQWYERINGDLLSRVEPLLDRLGIVDEPSERQDPRSKLPTPGLFEVTASAINIMQDRITRSRMAGDPPDLLISPRLAHLGLMEFDRAEEAIEEGYRAVQRQLTTLNELFARSSSDKTRDRR